MRAGLNQTRVGVIGNAEGREFHSVEEATLKALLLKVQWLVQEMESRHMFEDCRFGDGACWWKRSNKYWRARE